MVILDTDHLSVLERREQPGVGNVLPFGWVAAIGSGDDGNQLRGTDAGLDGLSGPGPVDGPSDHGLWPTAAHLENYRRIPVLGFDEAAGIVFQRLRRSRTADWHDGPEDSGYRLARDATLLSRNLDDFRHIPDLHVEDWTSSR